MLVLHTRNYSSGAPRIRPEPIDDWCVPSYSETEKQQPYYNDSSQVSQSRCILLAVGALFVSLGASICVINVPVGIMLILLGIFLALSPCVKLTKTAIKDFFNVCNNSTIPAEISHKPPLSSASSIEEDLRPVSAKEVLPQVIYDPLKLPSPTGSMRNIAYEEVLVRDERRRSSVQSTAYLLYDVKSVVKSSPFHRLKRKLRLGKKPSKAPCKPRRKKLM